MSPRQPDPAVWAARMAAEWAQRIGLPPGNLWEPAIARYALRQCNERGGDGNARAFTEAMLRMQLGIDHYDAEGREP